MRKEKAVFWPRSCVPQTYAQAWIQKELPAKGVLDTLKYQGFH